MAASTSSASAALDTALLRLVECLTPTPAAWAQRQAHVNEHIRRLQQHWNCSHPIRLSPFGSSLSGLCLADSDIDLGLVGSVRGCELLALHAQQPQQSRQLLYSIMAAVHRARLASSNKVQAVMGARVPVLKYKCALSGLDCDISIQGSGALLKANFMAVLNQHCPALSPLYRLVKLWAASHDLNDAARSTFNSTSLLYLTVFFLQLQQLVPPLRELVDVSQLCDPARRLLHPANKQLWDQPQNLSQLLGAAQARAGAWVHQQQRLHGPAWSQFSLGQLLHGFFSYYSGLLSEWVLGRSRDVYADLWAGQLTTQHPPGEQLNKNYVFNVQDPFDPEDCPARAIGTMHSTNNGVGVLISFLITCSNMAMQRYHQVPVTASMSSRGGSSGGGVRQRLCQCLGWLFGPAAVLHLAGPEPSQPGSADRAWSSSVDEGTPTVADAAAAAAAAESLFGSAAGPDARWQDWAACPFDPQLCAKLQQHHAKMLRQQEQQHSKGRRAGHAETPGSIFRWLVSSLGAAIEPEHGPCVLTLQHLSVLNKRIDKGVALSSVGAQLSAGGAVQQRVEQPQEVEQPQQQDPQVLIIKQQLAELTAGAAAQRVEEGQRQQQLEEERRRWQQQRLPGPPLPQPDPQVFLIQQQLARTLGQQRPQPQRDGKRRNPDSHLKIVKAAARDAITQVARRLMDIGGASSSSSSNTQQQQQQVPPALPRNPAAAAAAPQAEQAEGIGGFGLLAVLQQHGFMELLERWHFVEDGVLWPKLLPLPEQLQPQPQQQHGGGSAVGGGATAATADTWFEGHGSTHTPAAAAATTSSTSSTSSTSRQQHSQPQPQVTGSRGKAVSSKQLLTRVLPSPPPQQPRRQQQQRALDVQLAVTARGPAAGLVSSSITVSGLADTVQHLTLDLGFTTQTAPPAAASSSRSSRTQGHHASSQQQPLQQRSARQQAAASPAVRVVPRPRAVHHHTRPVSPQPAAAASSVPIDIAPAATQAAAVTHGDALAESYCRSLQQKLSSPPTRGIPVNNMQQQQQKQQAKQKQQKDSQSRQQHQQRARQAEAKVKTLQQRARQVEGRVAAREQELSEHSNTVDRLLAAGAGSAANVPAGADRTAFLEARACIHSCETSLRAQRAHLTALHSQLAAAQADERNVKAAPAPAAAAPAASA